MKVFDKIFLINELDLPANAIENKITGTSRWSIDHEIVFEYEGKYYQTCYSVGATEMQYEGPWEYEDEIECIEVELKEVLVKQWIPIKEGE